jgi:hypothetical protein
MPGALQTNTHLVSHVGDLALEPARIVELKASPTCLELDESPDAPAYVIVMDRDHVAGVVSREWALAHRELLVVANTVGELIRDDSIVVAADMTVFELLARMRQSRVAVAVVLASASESQPSGPSRALRVLTKARLAEEIAHGMELFAD